MNCRAAEELIQRSLDAPLSTSERARLDAHLSVCSACRQAQGRYRRLSQAAGEWARRPGPSELSTEEFSARVMARLTARPAPHPLWLRPLAAGLALGLGVALSPYFSRLLLPFSLWHLTWMMPPLDSWLRGWGDGLRAAPQEALGLWEAVNDSLLASRWAALLLAVALPMNALLCLRARRGARRSA